MIPARKKICVLYSKTQINFDALMTDIMKAPSKMYETIMSDYKSQIIPVKNIAFGDAQISFDAKATEQQMVCFFINLNHK